MHMIVRAAVVAFVSTLAVPASAALLQYDFTAGGDGSSSQEYSYNYATGQSSNTYNNFSLTARFILDTSKMTQAANQSVQSGVQSYFDNYYGGEAFMSSTATKTGGTMPLAITSASTRSYFYAYDNPYGNEEYFSLYSGNQTNANYYTTEYHSNGQIARQTHLNEYISFSFYGSDDLLDLGIADGAQVVTALRSLSNAYLQVGNYFYDYSFDEAGNQTGYDEGYSYSRAQLTSASAGPVTSDVPEPATLSLLGLGVLGMALRRRKTA